MSSYAPSADVCAFHAIPRLGAGADFQLPPTLDLLAATRTTPYYMAIAKPAIALLCTGALSAALLLGYQLNLYLCKRRCCCCTRFTFPHYATPLALLALASCGLAAAGLVLLARLSTALATLHGALSAILATLTTLATTATTVEASLGALSASGRALSGNATLAATACAPLPPLPPCIPGLPCPTDPNAACLAALAPLAASAGAASDAASAAASSVVIGLGVFSATTRGLVAAMDSVPWGSIEWGIKRAGTGLVAVIVFLSLTQLLLAPCARASRSLRAVYGAASALGVTLLALLFALAAFLYAASLLAADFCYAPAPTLGRLLTPTAAAPTAASAAQAATLTFILACVGAPPPTGAGASAVPATNSTTSAMAVLQAGSATLAAASSFSATFAALPSPLRPLLPAAAATLAASFSASSAGLASMLTTMACPSITALLDPAVTALCVHTAGSLLTLTQLVLASAVLMLLQQVVGYLLAENVSSGTGGVPVTLLGMDKIPPLVPAIAPAWHSNPANVDAAAGEGSPGSAARSSTSTRHLAAMDAVQGQQQQQQQQQQQPLQQQPLQLLSHSSHAYILPSTAKDNPGSGGTGSASPPRYSDAL